MDKKSTHKLDYELNECMLKNFRVMNAQAIQNANIYNNKVFKDKGVAPSLF
jgi:hypothetical protein